ncbi:MAG: hypothetical protein AAB276_04600 [Pseudomonadota bacterium]|mgnify:CR=1 FL=1
MNKKKIILIVAGALFLIFAALGAGGYFYWSNLKKTAGKDISPNAIQTAASLAEDIAQSATQGAIPSINTNSLENKPDINPADKANPFTNIETNPFK